MPSQKPKLAAVASALSHDPREAPRLARQAGFVGLQLDARSTALDVTSLSGTGRRELRQVMSAQDQQLVGLRSDLGPKGFGPGADVDRLLEALDRVVEACKGLSAPLVCIELGPLPTPPRQPKPRPAVTSEQAGAIIIPTLTAAPAPESTNLHDIPAAVDPVLAAQVEAALADLGERADRYGVMIAFSSELASLAALEQALRRANCPWFGVDLDPVAILRDEWDADETFSRLGALIRHVRGRDATVGADRRTRPAVVGRGDTDWGQLLADLDAGGYSGWITLDPTEIADREAAAASGLAHLRSLLD